MDVQQIHKALDRIFNEEQARIVFWNDPERDFEALLPALDLERVEILKLADAAGGASAGRNPEAAASRASDPSGREERERTATQRSVKGKTDPCTVGALEAKIRMEREQPQGRFLLYQAGEEPEYDKDWLLDIRLYSRSFRADRASILLQALDLRQQQLRTHLQRRRKFFDNQERLRKLKQLVAPDDDDAALDRKMLAVVTRADQPELFDILRTLLHSMAEGEGAGLDAVPAAWEQVEKLELDEPFWRMIHEAFGYTEEMPSLKSLLIRLMVSDLAASLGTELPASLQHLQLSRSGSARAVVCLAQWRDSSSKAASFDRLSDEVGALLKIADALRGLETEALLDVVTFVEVEKAIVRGLLERVRSTAETIDASEIRAIARQRQAAHWVASASVPDAQRNARSAIHEGLAAAAELFALRNRHRDGFEASDVAELYRAYETELFRFDLLYRHFCWNADVAASQGWDMLKPLRQDVESCYCHWYLTRLGLSWGQWMGPLLQHWSVPGVPNQHRFFERWIRPRLNESQKRRVFVIISDALRYEIAHELTALLNGAYRLEAELSSQLGVLPSYTALGMASLLPHKVLEYGSKGEVLLDGGGTSSLEQRDAILVKVGGMAVKADELLHLTKTRGRELIGDRQVIYVYHDEIDARGDKAATEGDTFEAAAKAIGELADLVRHIVNNLNGNTVLITADHGFLYTDSGPGETEKSTLSDKPEGTVLAKKRFLLGFGLPDSADAWHGHTSRTAGAEGGMELWVPKGANRFHFVGGARFVHGGAMPQEIVVPVITVKHLKDKETREKTRARQVAVQVLGAKHKITTASHRFVLLQMEPVSDRVKAIVVKVAIYEGDDVVTNVETVTFDSQSSTIDERQKPVILTLVDHEYDKRKPYRLLLRDSETGIEHQSVDVTIDRAIIDDFDF
jgi:uncharacterized protein (TIGR02687 family)